MIRKLSPHAYYLTFVIDESAVSISDADNDSKSNGGRCV
jgi:hypothetical protein